MPAKRGAYEANWEFDAALLFAECRAGTAPCRNARLPMQSRFDRSPAKVPLARSEDSSPAIGMSPKRSPPTRRPDGERDRRP
jgi:hypothetical protein